MKIVFLLIISVLTAIALPQPRAAAIETKDIEQAAKIFCDAMKAGKRAPEAKEAATEYITEQINKNDKPNYQVIRQQMRDSVTKTCPEQAKKVPKL